MPLANAKSAVNSCPFRLLANHRSKMAAQSAVNAMQTALELLREESEDHQTLQHNK